MKKSTHDSNYISQQLDKNNHFFIYVERMFRMFKEAFAIKYIFNTFKYVQLFFQREKKIVKNITFLLITTNDSTKVVTICFEKIRDRRICIIRLTSNNDNLDEIMHEFMFMTNILKRKLSKNLHFAFIKIYFCAIDDISINNKNNNKKSLFRYKITLYYCYILFWLQSK